MGPGDPGGPADPGLLVPLLEGQHSQGGPEARVLLTTRKKQKSLSVKDKCGCWLPESFLRKGMECKQEMGGLEE